MTAVHHNNHTNHGEASGGPGRGSPNPGEAGGRPGSQAGSVGTRSPAGFGFFRSGLGTPDFSYFSQQHHGGASSSHGDTPSWFKGPDSSRQQSPVKQEDPPQPGSEANTSNDGRAQGSVGDSRGTTAKTAESASTDAAGNKLEATSTSQNEDPARVGRSLSDPPIRQTPSWILPKNKLDQEPNPFEHSFRPEDGDPGADNIDLSLAAVRRARSQSPKSSHGFASLLPTRQATAAQGAAHSPRQPKLPSLGHMSTPSNDLSQFGWALDSSLRSGPLSPSMLNGPAYSTASPSLNGSSIGGGGHFDPSSIRTGFTPGGLGGGPGGDGIPHSPATQALFAMMTNQTPGIPPLKADDGFNHKSNEKADPSATGTSHSNPTSSRSSSSAPARSPQHHAAGTVNDGGMMFNTQAIPRQMQPYARNGPPPHPHPSQDPHVQQQFQAARNAFLQHSVPRPIPASARLPYIHSSDSRMHPQHHQQQPSQSQTQQPAGVVPSATNTTSYANNQNPLYLLSQAHSHLDPVDLSTDDALLAATALSGLATPRTANVGGSAPSAAPGHLTTANANQADLAKNLRIPRPPAKNIQSQTSSGSAYEGAQQQNSGNGTAKGTGKKAGNSAGPVGGGASRKRKGAATGDQAGDSGNKKTRRASSRKTATAASMTEPADSLEEGGNNGDGGDGDDDDDEDGSMDGSGIGGQFPIVSAINANNATAQARDAIALGRPVPPILEDTVPPPQKGKGGGRGPKQQFETENDKRKNFLERNRQAALKCRQRKKQWLGQLQTKVEYLTSDNEVLQHAVTSLREELSALRAVLASHADCSIPTSLTALVGANGVPLLPSIGRAAAEPGGLKIASLLKAGLGNGATEQFGQHPGPGF